MVLEKNGRSYGRAKPLVEYKILIPRGLSDLVCQDVVIIQYKLLMNSYKVKLCK